MGWYEELNKILSAAGRQVQGQHIPKPKDIHFTNHFQAIAMLRKPPHSKLHHLHLVVISKCPGYMLPIDHTIGILIKPEASVDIAEFLNFRAQGIEERFSQGRQPHLKPIDVYPFTPLHTRSTEFAKEVYGSNTHIY